jgi:CheY-like chemotaxis protein
MKETIPFTNLEAGAIKKGPILLVEDNPGDQKLIKLALESINIPNKLIIAKNALEAIEILKKGDIWPFLIISDINMPEMNGLDFKRAITDSADIKQKGIPFIFMSSSTERTDIRDAYCVQAQGYFEKTSQFDALTKQLKLIVDYWDTSEVPIIY